MKPLSKEASAALSALKATDPTAADEARVRQHLERALGIAIPAATIAVATTAATAQAATGASVWSGLASLGLGAKALVFVVAVGVGSVVAVGIKTSLSSRGGEGRGEETKPALLARAEPPAPPPVLAPEPIEPEPVVPAPEVPAAPMPRARPQPVSPPAPELAPLPEAPEPPEVVTAPPPPPPTEATYELEVESNFPNCDPATEMRSAVTARKLLDASRAEEAVWLLGAYQRRCPSGRWSDEAWSVRMAGLCRLGRTAEVIGLLEWFGSEYPSRRAAVVADLRSSCPEEVLRHGEPAK